MTPKDLWLLLLIILILGVICLYFFFSPTEHTFFPKCLIRTITGYYCPACGGQRALHALLHGELTTAIKYNLFACISIPYLLILLLCRFSKRHSTGVLNRVAHSHFLSYAYMVLFFSWWVVRNIFNL